MNRIAFLITMAITFSLITGCDQNSVGARQPMPASTMSVVDWAEDCHDSYYRMLDNAEVHFIECMDRDNSTYEQCRDQEDEERENAGIYREDCLLNIPNVSGDCIAQLQPDSKEQDTDSDGVSDFHELRMALNPCEPCSYGGTPGVDCDGDLDYDRDEVPNAEDSHPMCGMLWEDEWHNDGPDYRVNDGRCI